MDSVIQKTGQFRLGLNTQLEVNEKHTVLVIQLWRDF